ncbi:SPOR domain-containing protein [Asinibacterium sp. OR53]|uniref:SPOR domain-containing protein n=1 Tax=Asinibacterium sp. OR53 TaxID=925409 RepID=UPI00047D7E0E|nr:SPOR domain-containing protein [Asinibacterium sp. OR53]
MGRIKHTIILLLLAAYCVQALANDLSADSVILSKDHRLDILTTKQVQINKRTAMMTSSGLYKGYRIQVVSTNKRDLAFKTKAELLARFPDQKSYTMFQSPYFKVRIGNFIRKEEAERLRKQLMKFYPQGVYVVEDAIEYTPKDEEEIIPQ